MDTFAVSKIADMDEEQVKQLGSGVPSISEETVSQAVDFIQERIEQILTSCDSTQ